MSEINNADIDETNFTDPNLWAEPYGELPVYDGIDEWGNPTVLPFVRDDTGDLELCALMEGLWQVPAVPDVPDCDQGMANWLAQIPVPLSGIQDPLLQAQVFHARYE